MKIEGIDHVAIIVKDLDRVTQFFNKLFEMDFEEVPRAVERWGMRISISRPDGQIELVSVVDPAKAAKLPPPFKWMAETAARGVEGVCNLFLRVKDAEEAAADARSKGVRVAHILDEKQLMEEGPLLDFIPYSKIKEVFFSEEDIPFKWFTLMQK
jgi:catechol 2,3-dioxygenase-like lactoylglutathione lyase family enzyme